MCAPAPTVRGRIPLGPRDPYLFVTELVDATVASCNYYACLATRE